MAVFYNSSAIVNTASITNATAGNIVATNAVITGTVQSATVAAIRLSGAVSSENVTRLIFSNSNTISFGVNTDTNGVTVTGSLPSNISISVSAGGTNGGISTLIFSNSSLGGVGFGLSTAGGGGTITANTSVTYSSYFRYPNAPYVTNTANAFSNLSNTNSTTNYVQPFNLPYPISASYIRIPISQGINSYGPVLNTNFTGSASWSQSFNIYFHIYTLGTGASSTALNLLRTASASSLWAWRASVAAAGSSQTIQQYLSYGLEGNTSSYSTQYNATTSIVLLESSHLTGFTGNRFLDINTSLSLDKGPYWLAYAVSYTTSGSSSGWNTTVANNTRHSFSFNNFVLSQYTSAFLPMGATSGYVKLGYGQLSGATTATIALSNVTSATSHIEIPFEIRGT